MFEHDEMTEQTNLTEEVETDAIGEADGDEADGLDWWDDEAEETEEETEESEAEETETEQQEEQETDEQTSEQEEMFPQELIVYGEKKQVTMTEAKNLIQKGLAYDRAVAAREGRLQTALSDPRLAFVDELAKAAGVEVSEYIAKTRMQNEYSSLLETYGSIENVPENIMKMFTENAQANRDKMEQAFAQQKQDQWMNEKAEELEAFIEKHPEVKDIPQEAMQLVANGESLEGAWAMTELPKALQQISDLKEEIEKLKTSNKILKQNEKNKQTKLPSAQSKGKKMSEAEAWWD